MCYARKSIENLKFIYVCHILMKYHKSQCYTKKFNKQYMKGSVALEKEMKTYFLAINFKGIKRKYVISVSITLEKLPSNM